MAEQKINPNEKCACGHELEMHIAGDGIENYCCASRCNCAKYQQACSTPKDSSLVNIVGDL